MESEATLPFSIEDLWCGLARVEGEAIIGSGFLVLEYHLRDAVLGLYQSRRKRIRVLFEDIKRVNLEKTVMRRRLTITPRMVERTGHEEDGGMSVTIREDGPFRRMPGQRDGEVSLSIHRLHRSKSDQFFEVLESELSRAQERLRQEGMSS